jgi:hypothetical protein
MSQRLGVLDQGRLIVDAFLGRAPQAESRFGQPARATIDDCGGLSCDVPMSRSHDADRRLAQTGSAPFLKRLLQRPLGRPRTSRQIHDDIVGAEGFGRKNCPIQHQVRAQRDQRSVLRAQRLTLRRVDHHHRVPIRALRHCGPLPPGWKPRSAATAQATLRDDVEQHRTSGWAGPKASLVVIDALKPCGRRGTGHEPGADGGSDRDLVSRQDGRHQFNGPDVTSRPVI